MKLCYVLLLALVITWETENTFVSSFLCLSFLHAGAVRSTSHQLSHRSHLSIHPSTSHPHGSSRTQPCPAGHWCHYGYDRAIEKEHGGSWCPADWFLICGEETVHLEMDCSSSYSWGNLTAVVLSVAVNCVTMQGWRKMLGRSDCLDGTTTS